VLEVKVRGASLSLTDFPSSGVVVRVRAASRRAHSHSTQAEASADGTNTLSWVEPHLLVRIPCATKCSSFEAELITEDGSVLCANTFAFTSLSKPDKWSNYALRLYPREPTVDATVAPARRRAANVLVAKSQASLTHVGVLNVRIRFTAAPAQQQSSAAKMAADSAYARSFAAAYLSALAASAKASAALSAAVVAKAATNVVPASAVRLTMYRGPWARTSIGTVACTRDIFSCGPCGGLGGDAFARSQKTHKHGFPTAIEVMYNSQHVHGLIFHHGKYGTAVRYGPESTYRAVFPLSIGEFVTGVRFIGDRYIDAIAFDTSLGVQSGWYGCLVERQHQNVVNARPGTGLVTVSGRSGHWMDQLTFHFATPRVRSRA